MPDPGRSGGGQPPRGHRPHRGVWRGGGARSRIASPTAPRPSRRAVGRCVTERRSSGGPGLEDVAEYLPGVMSPSCTGGGRPDHAGGGHGGGRERDAGKPTWRQSAGSGSAAVRRPPASSGHGEGAATDDELADDSGPGSNGQAQSGGVHNSRRQAKPESNRHGSSRRGRAGARRSGRGVGRGEKSGRSHAVTDGSSVAAEDRLTASSAGRVPSRPGGRRDRSMRRHGLVGFSAHPTCAFLRRCVVVHTALRVSRGGPCSSRAPGDVPHRWPYLGHEVSASVEPMAAHQSSLCRRIALAASGAMVSRIRSRSSSVENSTTIRPLRRPRSTFTLVSK